MTLILDLAYLIALVVLAPVIAIRAIFSERWRAGWAHRFGSVPRSEGDGPGVWVHAASVGEANTARTLVEAMRREHPDWRVAVSTNTNTGHRVASDRFGDSVTRFYFPLDISLVIRRVLSRVRPDVLVLIEGEFWPNLLRVARRRRLPVVLVNGRMREKVCVSHQRFRPLYAPLHDPETRNVYCVQNETYADRFRRAGFPPDKTRVTGTMKYDVVRTEVDMGKLAELRAALGLAPDAQVWLGACTWPGEERICLNVHRRLLAAHPNLRLLLVPRHVERANEVGREIEEAGFTCFRRSAAPAAAAPGAVLMLDTVGELGTAYALGAFAFVGRSLADGGGHNMLEPAALSVPAVFGPRTENFAEEARLLLDAGAAELAGHADRLYDTGLRLLSDDGLRSRMGEAGRRAVLAQRGATGRHLRVIEDVIGRHNE